MNIDSISISGQVFTSQFFGGNVLSNRNDLQGEGGYAEAIDDLGVTGLRFPGGSLTEYYFDISNPDAALGTHSETGEEKSLIPLSDFLNFAGDNGHSVTLVVPTRHYLSDERDENGNRFAILDEDELRTFVRDVATGQYGEATIDAFEVGNEYWHSGGMTSTEYGRVAAEVSRIIDSEITEILEEFPEAEHIDVIVQMGYNSGTSDLEGLFQDTSPAEVLAELNERYGLTLDEDAMYSGGDINFNNVNNEIIISELIESGQFHAVDGVVAHIYSWGEEHEGSRSFLLDQIGESWLEANPEIETYVTEWNIRGFSEGLDEHEDYGLFQAAEMLNMLEVFLEHDVHSANVWPLIQRTDNALSTSNEYGETNAPGAFFEMMADNLPGKLMLDFNPYDDSATEAEFEGFSVHGYADEHDLLLYATSSHRDGVIETKLDLNELIVGFDSIEISVLGVKEGDEAGSNESEASVEVIDSAEMMETGFIDIPLDPGEIIQIIIKGYDPSEELSIATGNGSVFEDILIDEPFIPLIPLDGGEEPYVPADGSEVDHKDDGGDDFGFAWLLVLLPLAALMGMG